MMTCSRRYLSASECGSSRVLMIGRLSVVSRPTSTSKKSARWETWKAASRPSWPMPTRPAPVTTWRLTKNGVRCRTMSPNGVARHDLTGLVPEHDVTGVGALGCGVLRVRVIDVEPGAVGEDDVGEPEVL